MREGPLGDLSTLVDSTDGQSIGGLYKFCMVERLTNFMCDCKIPLNVLYPKPLNPNLNQSI
jgi:hypothetical protein